MTISRTVLAAAAALMAFLPVTPVQAADSEWSRKVAQLISAKYSYPRSAQLRGEQGRVRIKIAFSPTGKVLSVDLVESSGSAILDREAVRIPMKVATFPPPPNHANVELVYPISFRIEQ